MLPWGLAGGERAGRAGGALGKAGAISLWEGLGARASPSLRSSYPLLPGTLQPQGSLTPQEAASLSKAWDSIETPFPWQNMHTARGRAGSRCVVPCNPRQKLQRQLLWPPLTAEKMEAEQGQVFARGHAGGGEQPGLP